MSARFLLRMGKRPATKAQVAAWTLAGLATIVAAMASSSDTLDAATSSNKCYTAPTSWGFARTHTVDGATWNWCNTETYGPPEWMYWNYYPGTPGYNDPGNGPYFSYVARAIQDWGAIQNNWIATYKAGDWARKTDLFLQSIELDPYGSNLAGLVQHFWCTSPTSCTFRPIYQTYGSGKYNLIYLYLDDDGTANQGVVAHEFGHAFGLVHGTASTCDFRLMTSACGYSSASSLDAYDVNLIYPDP